MSFASRVRAELNIWRAQWMQVDGLLERLDAAVDEDAPWAEKCGALLDLAAVIERVSAQRFAVGLAPPLAHAIRGVGLTSTGAELAERERRLPGLEECDIAVTLLKTNEDGEVDDDAEASLDATLTLFKRWDAEAGTLTPVKVPAYDFGLLNPYTRSVPPIPLPGWLMIPEGLAAPIDQGLFTRELREEAAKNGHAVLRTWKDVYDERRGSIDDQDEILDAYGRVGDLAGLLDKILQNNASSQERSDALALADKAESQARNDQPKLSAVRKLFEDDDEEPLLALIDVSLAELATLVQRYDAVGKALRANSTTKLVQARAGLVSPMWDILLTSRVHELLSDAIAVRVSYPDGPLRVVRVVEWMLARHWLSRAAWFAFRRERVLKPTMTSFLRPLRKGLAGLLGASRSTLAPLPAGCKLSAPVTAQGTGLPLVRKAGMDITPLRVGHLVAVGGNRPTIAVVVGDDLTVDGSPLIVTMPLRVSQSAARALPGVAGMVDMGAPVTTTIDHAVTGTALLRGEDPSRLQDSGIVLEILATWSRVALLVGRSNVVALPAPYDATTVFTVEASESKPLQSQAIELVLPSPPEARWDRTSRPPKVFIAAPGELMLLRGKDLDGTWWQSAVEVSTATAATRRQLGQDEDPDCIDPEEWVGYVQLATNRLAVALVGSVTLHRDFRGFGWASLATKVLLPPEVDPDTPIFDVGPNGALSTGTGTSPNTLVRDAELAVAVDVIEQWLRTAP